MAKHKSECQKCFIALTTLNRVPDLENLSWPVSWAAEHLEMPTAIWKLCFNLWFHKCRRRWGESVYRCIGLLQVKAHCWTSYMSFKFHEACNCQLDLSNSYNHSICHLAPFEKPTECRNLKIFPKFQVENHGWNHQGNYLLHWCTVKRMYHSSITITISGHLSITWNHQSNVIRSTQWDPQRLLQSSHLQLMSLPDGLGHHPGMQLELYCGAGHCRVFNKLERLCIYSLDHFTKGRM